MGGSLIWPPPPPQRWRRISIQAGTAEAAVAKLFEHLAREELKNARADDIESPAI
jgi:hypothetical protein